MTKKEEKDLRMDIDTRKAFEDDIELTDEQLDWLKSTGACANDYHISNYCDVNKCGEDSDCNECWDYANKHRFDD